MEQNIQLREGARKRIVVELKSGSGELLPPECFFVYGAAFAAGHERAQFVAERNAGGWVLTVPGLCAAGCGWLYEVYAAEYATGVEWVLCSGEIEVLPRVAGAMGMAAQELRVEAVLDKEVLEVHVSLGESTAVCGVAAQVAQAAQKAAEDAARDAEREVARIPLIEGPQGPQGEPGPQGPQGERGPQGEAAELTVAALEAVMPVKFTGMYGGEVRDMRASGVASFALGHGAGAVGGNALGFGYAASAGETNAVAIGPWAFANGKCGVALGTGASAQGNYGVSIGSYSYGISDSISLGYNAKVNSAQCMALGNGAVVPYLLPHSTVVGEQGRARNAGAILLNAFNAEGCSLSVELVAGHPTGEAGSVVGDAPFVRGAKIVLRVRDELTLNEEKCTFDIGKLFAFLAANGAEVVNGDTDYSGYGNYV